MKRILNGTTNILFFLIFIGLVGIFAFSLQQGMASPPDTEVSQQAQSSYPGPIQSNEPVVRESANAYPGPSESKNSTLSTCIQNPRWETYTEQNAGYSISFPSSARLSAIDVGQEYKIIQISLDSSCFDISCRDSDSMGIIVWENLENLPIKDFVERKLSEDSYAETELAKRSSTFDILKNGGQYVEIANAQAIRIQDKNRSVELSNIIGLANPRVFVPHGKLVIEFYIGPPDAHQSFTPCRGSLKQFDHILESLQLNN